MFVVYLRSIWGPKYPSETPKGTPVATSLIAQAKVFDSKDDAIKGIEDVCKMSNYAVTDTEDMRVYHGVKSVVRVMPLARALAYHIAEE